MSKSKIKMINRSFRKAVYHWKGSRLGFKSEKSFRNWCRTMAVSYSKCECFDDKEMRYLNDIDPSVTITQKHYDEVISIEMSYWDY